MAANTQASAASRSASLLCCVTAWHYRLVPRRQKHFLRTRINVHRRVRTVSENRLAGRVGSMVWPNDRLLLPELFRFGRLGQRHGRRQPSADHLLHLIEVSGAHEALVLDRLVAVLRFAAEFL